jgi:hypothetical protein
MKSSHNRGSETHIGLPVKSRYFCRISNKSEMAQQFFAELPTIKFNKNLFNLSRVVTGVQTDGQRDFNRYSAGSNKDLI